MRRADGCRSLQINAVLQGFDIAGEAGGHAEYRRSNQSLRLLWRTIPADDPGLGSDWVTVIWSKEIESYREICRPLVARGDYTSEADCPSHDGGTCR